MESGFLSAISAFAEDARNSQIKKFELENEVIFFEKLKNLDLIGIFDKTTNDTIAKLMMQSIRSSFLKIDEQEDLAKIGDTMTRKAVEEFEILLNTGLSEQFLVQNALTISENIKFNYLTIYDHKQRKEIFSLSKPKILSKKNVEVDINLLLTSFEKFTQKSLQFNPQSTIAIIKNGEKFVATFFTSPLSATLAVPEVTDEKPIILCTLELLRQYHPLFLDGLVPSEIPKMKFEINTETASLKFSDVDPRDPITEMAIISIIEGAKNIMTKLHNRFPQTIQIRSLNDQDKGLLLELTFQKNDLVPGTVSDYLEEENFNRIVS
ncbi:MAG: hypothetical protein D6732_29615 [Methanobacteriota archaeon]|nr:MAG: hypothetical protein D6732_29615 [Euryarchaeota archaeon]